MRLKQLFTLLNCAQMVYNCIQNVQLYTKSIQNVYFSIIVSYNCIFFKISNNKYTIVYKMYKMYNCIQKVT